MIFFFILFSRGKRKYNVHCSAAHREKKLAEIHTYDFRKKKNIKKIAKNGIMISIIMEFEKFYRLLTISKKPLYSFIISSESQCK